MILTRGIITCVRWIEMWDGLCTPLCMRLRTEAMSRQPSRVNAACHFRILNVFPAWNQGSELGSWTSYTNRLEKEGTSPWSWTWCWERYCCNRAGPGRRNLRPDHCFPIPSSCSSDCLRIKSLFLFFLVAASTADWLIGLIPCKYLPVKSQQDNEWTDQGARRGWGGGSGEGELSLNSIAEQERAGICGLLRSVGVTGQPQPRLPTLSLTCCLLVFIILIV